MILPTPWRGTAPWRGWFSLVSSADAISTLVTAATRSEADLATTRRVQPARLCIPTKHCSVNARLSVNQTGKSWPLRCIVKSNLLRNAQIVEMKKAGVLTTTVARKFRLSRSRVQQIELRATEEATLADRSAMLLVQLREADDPGKVWPVHDLLDACLTSRLTKARLLKHFARTEQTQISLQALMDMCLQPPPNSDSMLPPLLRVAGFGRKRFWSVADGLTNTDLGSRCNEEWRSRLVRVKLFWGGSS